MKNLFILIHPQAQDSAINQGITKALEAQQRTDTKIKNLYALYPDFKIDIAQEQKDLQEADRIVLQFPLYWYSAPALLKEWIDKVFTMGFAYSYDGSKTALVGKKLLLSITTGSGQETYTNNGQNKLSIENILLPFEGTAHFCKMIFEKPILTYGAIPNLSQEALTQKIKQHLELLQKALDA